MKSEKQEDSGDIIKKSGNQQEKPETPSIEEQSQSPDKIDEDCAAKESNQENVSELLDQLLRARADYDNLRKRSLKEVQEAKLVGRCDMLKEIIPFIDSLEAAVGHNKQLMPLRKQFVDILTKAGVVEYAPVGERADPVRHEIIAVVPTDDEAKDGLIASVIRKGYGVGEKIVRYPGVAVYSYSSEKDSDNACADEKGKSSDNVIGKKEKKSDVEKKEVDVDENNRN